MFYLSAISGISFLSYTLIFRVRLFFSWGLCISIPRPAAVSSWPIYAIFPLYIAFRSSGVFFNLHGPTLLVNTARKNGMFPLVSKLSSVSIITRCWERQLLTMLICCTLSEVVFLTKLQRYVSMNIKGAGQFDGLKNYEYFGSIDMSFCGLFQHIMNYEKQH